MAIANDILKKGTRGSFLFWDKDDHDLVVTVIQNPHTLGGFGLTSRFLGLVGSLTLEEQQLWFPNQQDHDPDSWTVPHLLQLKMEYEVLINKYGSKVQEMYTV